MKQSSFPGCSDDAKLSIASLHLAVSSPKCVTVITVSWNLTSERSLIEASAVRVPGLIAGCKFRSIKLEKNSIRISHRDV